MSDRKQLNDSYWPELDYSYAYSLPKGFGTAQVNRDVANASADLDEFVLPYEAVRNAHDPDGALMDFLQGTFQATAKLGPRDLQPHQRRHFPPG